VLLKNDYKPSDQNLESFVAGIKVYLQEAKTCLDFQIEQYSKSNSKKQEVPRLEQVVETLNAMSPMVQIDYTDRRTLEKFCFVTNVRLKDGELLLREPNQSAALIDQEDIREAMKDFPEAHKRPDVDRVLAGLNLSNGKSSLT
jgi:hypothetical protein